MADFRVTIPRAGWPTALADHIDMAITRAATGGETVILVHDENMLALAQGALARMARGAKGITFEIEAPAHPGYRESEG